MAFLLFVSLLALSTALLAVYINWFQDEARPSELQEVLWWCDVVMLYTGLVGLGLLAFFFMHLCKLALRNVTTNEDLRHRWNNDPKNVQVAHIHRNRSTCCSRLRYIFWSPVPDSKL